MTAERASRRRRGVVRRWSLIARGALRRGNRWSERMILGGVPEQDLFPDERTRREAVDRVDEAMEKGSEFWVKMTLALVVWVAICLACNWAIENFIVQSAWVTVVGAPLALLGSVAVVLWTWRHVASRRLRRALIESGVPVCLRCGYPLRGLRSDHAPQCPECGWRVSRRVRSVMEATIDHAANTGSA